MSNKNDTSIISWLLPEDVSFITDDNSNIRVVVKNTRSVLRPVLCRAFPLTNSNQYIELREFDGEPLGIFKDIDTFSSQSKKYIENLLNNFYHIPNILQINKLSFVMGTWKIDVETDKGEITFFIKKPQNNIRYISKQNIILTDPHGNHFNIPDINLLNSRSKTLLDKLN